MSMKKNNARILLRMLVFLLFTTISTTLSAQEKRTISGYISEEETGEKLIGATIYDTVHRLGAVTNEYGFFSLTVPDEEVVVKVTSFGLTPRFFVIPKDVTFTTTSSSGTV